MNSALLMSNTKLNKSQRIALIVISMIAIGLVMAQICFASGEGPFGMVANAITAVYDELRTLSTGIALLAAVCALLVRMFSRNPQAKATSTSWLIGIVIAWVAIQTLGLTLDWLQNLFPTEASVSFSLMA